MSEFEPKIVAYCCNFCAFAAADLAGAMRLQYPPNVRIVRLPCTGKVDAIHLMKAFEDGADGVFVAGCLEGQCHYLEGNLRAKKRVAYVKKLLAEVQIEPERIDMFNLSSAMGGRFAEIVEEMTQRIKDLGPVNANETRQAVKS
ncbi:MAG: hydrogenase iron-sulfur subunit [Planctomycetota bacterium]|jgi:coenzyme F420-reducing hydrogenase delta subunit